jgi:hypothetical protein
MRARQAADMGGLDAVGILLKRHVPFLAAFLSIFLQYSCRRSPRVSIADGIIDGAGRAHGWPARRQGN